MNSISFFLINICILASAQVFASNHFPVEYLNLLKKHKIWQSIPYTKLPVGSSFQLTVGLQKKWLVSSNYTDGDILRELTDLSIRYSNENKKFEWYSEKILLSEPVAIEKIVMTKNQNEDLIFEKIGNDSFTIKRIDKSVNIIFTPENRGISYPFQKSNISLHVGTAPLGFSSDTFKNSGFEKVPVSYLHHNLNAMKKIWVSPDFPQGQHNTLIQSLKKWNQALGSNIFDLNIKIEKINQEKCFVNNVLCFIWIGSKQIPWSGMMALTTMSFDPISGNIIGGVISINNLAPENLETTPIDVVESASSHDPGLKWIAEQFAHGDKFEHYLHPFPSRSLQYFLLHEIGHFNGLMHNFAGSRRGTFNNPTDSIMDYLPFPANFKANQIGYLDHEMIDLVYKSKLPDKNYFFCGDSQLSGVSWTPNCDQRDIGDTLDWYKTLAEASPKGYFATTKSIVDFAIKDTPLIENISKYFDTDLRDHAKSILCNAFNSDIKNYLISKNINFDCD